jgi:drug/metabolite transporter (DMT)-like permease
MTIFIKVLPIILLTIIDTLIFKTEMTLYKGLGVFLIIGGIFLMEMPKN